MKRKNILKLTAATLAIIGAGTIIFNAMTETVMAQKVRQAESIPTSYRIPDSIAPALPEPETKEDDVKVNYHVSMDSCNTGTPTDVDLTMEEAAGAGARHLMNAFGLDLEGAYVYMMYYPGTETFPRAFWMGDVLFEEEQTPESTRWTYLVDAVTGELFTTCHGRQLDVSVPLGYDAALEKDYSMYAELAKKKAEECKFTDGKVDRVEYNCQGYSGNDPTITVDVVSENGEIVNMSFSRYDQAFLGITTDASRRITESALENFVGEEESMPFSR